METAITIYFAIGLFIAAMMPFCVKEIMQAKDGEYPEEQKDDIEEFRRKVSIRPAWAISLSMTLFSVLLIFAWPAFLGKRAK